MSQDVKIVSFIRIGIQTHESVSKSSMINDILSDKTHSTFLNQNACTSYETKKVITNGMVEASWLIPSNRSTNISQDVVMFLNLRGDSLKHEEEVRTLSSISDVIIILIHANILNKQNVVKHLDKIYSFDKCITYGIECRKGETEEHPEVQCFRKQFMLKKGSKYIKVEGEITLNLVRKFQRNIRILLSNKKAKQFSEVISKFKFGDDSFSVEGYTMAKDIMDFIDNKL